VDKNTEIAPNIHLVTLVSEKPGTLELRELSLVVNTSEGLAIVVGCSHPGIDRIVESATAINPRIHFIAGGFHLVVATDPDIEKIVTALHDRFKVEYVAPGHCSGEPAFTVLKNAFGDHYVYAGLGTTLTATREGVSDRLDSNQRPHPCLGKSYRSLQVRGLDPIKIVSALGAGRIGERSTAPGIPASNAPSRSRFSLLICRFLLVVLTACKTIEDQVVLVDPCP
jgi:7,8-dihydropterin-6-yl-methyl-4-(beta-D-ribofuranosyl)aminobenzene 5'-phosphate synthase